MKIIVAAFYADIVGQPSRFDEFLPFVLASQKALAATNRDAKYIVLTDDTTARLFENYNVNYRIVSPEHMPLMTKIVFAQREFLMRCDADLVVLPDVDCMANKSLDDATPGYAGIMITHRGKKFDYKINNLAYIRDRDLGVWFLDKAYQMLEQWPRAKHEWEGDQEAWQAVLTGKEYVEPANNIEYDFAELGNDHLVCRLGERDIYIAPCTTHNCIMSNDGAIRPAQRAAYMVHFKGDRKRHLDRWMEERFEQS